MHKEHGEYTVHEQRVWANEWHVRVTWNPHKFPWLSIEFQISNFIANKSLFGKNYEPD